MRPIFTLLCSLVALPALAGASAPPPAPRIVVQFDRSLGELHGRLLVFLSRVSPKSKIPVKRLEPDLDPHAVKILGTEIVAAAGSSVEVPVDADAYPETLRALTPGRYVARAELDVQHRYTYDGGQPGDPTSDNVGLAIAPGVVSTIAVHARRPDPIQVAVAKMPPGSGTLETFVSPSLSAFFGRPVALRAYVQPPKDYATSGRRYATVYAVSGFGASDRILPLAAASTSALLERAGGTQLIYVHLDPHVPLGHGVFADSLNNGPVGHALTTELIPIWNRVGA